jgi:hypothetical protein
MKLKSGSAAMVIRNKNGVLILYMAGRQMFTEMADGETNQLNVINLNCKGNKLTMMKLTNKIRKFIVACLLKRRRMKTVVLYAATHYQSMRIARKKEKKKECRGNETGI